MNNHLIWDNRLLSWKATVACKYSSWMLIYCPRMAERDDLCKAYSARRSWMRSALEPWIGSMGWHLTQNRRVPWANLFVVHGSNLFHCQSVWSWPTMNGTRFEWHVVQFMGTGFSDSMNAQTNIRRALSFDAGGICEVCSWFTGGR